MKQHDLFPGHDADDIFCICNDCLRNTPGNLRSNPPPAIAVIIEKLEKKIEKLESLVLSSFFEGADILADQGYNINEYWKDSNSRKVLTELIQG